MNNFDDYDFTPSSSSNLASLFGSSSTSSESSSLTYTAPKQPKLAEPLEIKSEPPQKAESSVICAQVVQVWKLVDSKYIPMGKHGFAIIGSSAQNAYEIILYREKRNVIVRVKINQNLEITSKKDNFASFYDSLKENWLIKFSNSNDCATLLSQIETFGGKTVTGDEKNESLQQTTKSIDKSENPENTTAKADILSRIAKMGQSILPNKNTDVDSESEDHFKAVEFVPPRENRSFESQPIVQASTATNAMQIPPRHFQNIPNTVVIGQPMAYDPLNLYIAENRAQNSEMRVNLSHLSDKVNQILKLVDNEKPIKDTNDDILKSRIKVLDLRNENLSKELGKHQEENAKLKLQLSQQYNVLRNLEESKVEIKLLNEQEAVKITEFKTEIKMYKDNIQSLHETVDKRNMEIEELKSQLKKCEDNSDLKNELSDLRQKLRDFEESQNSSKSSDQENQDKKTNFVAQLKNSMNEMYGNITGNLAEGKNYEASEINSIIAHNIKSTTLKIIHNFQEVYKNESETN